MERLLCFGGGDVADWAKNWAVVMPVDPFQGFPFGVAHRFLRADLVDDLSFAQADDAFGEGVVIGIFGGSD